MTYPWRASAAIRTAWLSAALTVVTLGVTAAWVVEYGVDQLAGRPALAVALAVAFFLAEQNLVTFEFRRQSHSMTFAGVPLALAVLILPVPALVVARFAGSLAAMIVQRTSAEKLAYNSAAFGFEAAVTATLARVVANGLDIVSVITLILCIAVVDQLMTALVLVVIRMHGARLRRTEVLQVLAQSLALSAVATSFAVVLRILIGRGATGYVLMTVLVGISVLAYRTYAGAIKRHESLAMVHEFVSDSASATGIAEVARHSLGRIREVLRASAAELMVVGAATGDQLAPWTVLHLDEHDQLTSSRRDSIVSDWVRMRAIHHGHATLAVRGRDAALDSWLDTAGPNRERVDDAIVVGLRAGSDPLGILTVSGRLTEMAVFTDDDVTLLQTLAGHLAASLHNARLLETLRFDATHDALTGLANRGSMAKRVEALSAHAAAAMLLLDLDRFKEVNDVLGHETGDRLLSIVGSRLRTALPDGATIARLGGDEFAVLLVDTDSPIETVARAAARRIRDTVCQPVRFDEAVITPEVSIGIALSPAVARQSLLRCADTAMYAAKASEGHVVVYEPTLDAGRAERLALVADLRAALSHSPAQFAVYYQPKIDLTNGAVCGAEALVRWLHPTLGLVPPDRFISLAEATGLIAELTRHVLVSALRECATWSPTISVAVNLSPRLVGERGIVALVRESLRETGVSPAQLVLEVTESAMFTDAETAIEVLCELAALGVSISLDDFGTGFSSLAYLQRLPVNELKIDRSFLAGLSAGTPNAEALLRSIASLGRNLGLRTVAEGIETVDQLDMTRAVGCEIGQGYHFAAPLPAGDFRAWLTTAQMTSGLRLLPAPA